MKDLFHEAERDKRETQRQNIITAFNMAGSGISSMMMNPKFLAKTAWMLLIGFGTYHLTRLSLALFSGLTLPVGLAIQPVQVQAALALLALLLGALFIG